MKNRNIIILLFVYLFFYLNNYIHPMSFGDDYLYSFIWTGQPMAVPLPENVMRVLSWNDLIKSQWLLYFTWGGRVVGQTLTQFFLWLGKDIFNIFNALASVILVAEIYWCANRGDINFKFDAGRICLIFFLLWAFTPGFNQIFLWITGSCIYLWPAVFLLAFLLLYIKKYYNYQKATGSGLVFNTGMFLFGIVAGCGNENSICWIIVALLFFLFLYRECPGKEPWLYFGVSGIVMGYALLILSPGNLARLHAEHGMDWFSFHVLENNISVFAAVLTFQLILWYFCLKALYVLKKKNYKKNNSVKKDKAFVVMLCTSSFLMTVIMIFSPFFPERSGFPGTILLIIASTVLFRLQSESGIVLMNPLVKKYLFCVGVVYFIMTTYVTIYHSYDTNVQMNAIINKAMQLQVNSANEILIVKPIKDSDQLTDLLSGYHLSNYYLSDDINDWRNVAFARYYSIKGIKVLNKLIFYE